MPFVPYTVGSRTATRALERFDDSFRGALAIAEPDSLWASQHGFVLGTDAPKTTFPIPLDAVGYKEFKGEAKYRALYSRAISIFNDKTWQDGVEEFAKIIELPDFIGWNDQPAKMATEWTRLPNTLVAQILEANPNLELYRDPDTGTLTSRALFATDHPSNILLPGLAQFNNTMDTTQAEILNGLFFKKIKKYARSIKGPNGQPMGIRATGGVILCTGEREDLLDEALKLDTVIREISSNGNITAPQTVGTAVGAVTVNNRHKGTMSYQVCDELTTASDDYLYVLLSGNAELYPWVVMQQNTPEVIIDDKSSDKYRRTHKVSYSSHGDCKAAALFPHRIVRVHITA